MPEEIIWGCQSPMKAALAKVREKIKERLPRDRATTAHVTAALLQSHMRKPYTNKFERVADFRNHVAVGAKGRIDGILDYWGVRMDFDPHKGEHVNLQIKCPSKSTENYAFLAMDRSRMQRRLAALRRLFRDIPRDDRDRGLHAYRALLQRKRNVETWNYDECVAIFAAPDFPARYKHHNPLSSILAMPFPWVARIRVLHEKSKFDHRRLGDETHLHHCAVRILRFFAKTYQREWRVTDQDLDRLKRQAGDVPSGRRHFLGSQVGSSGPRDYDIR